MTVENGKFVAIHYALKNDAGELVDASPDGCPLGYIQGGNQILAKLEEAVLGKSVGDKFSIVLEAADGYGEYEQGLVAEIDRANFETEDSIEVGMAFQAMTAVGPRIVRVTKVEGGKITVDGNHELAGQRLHFDIEVAEVREPTEEELAPSCGCGGCGGGNCGEGCDSGCGGGCGGCGN